MNEHSYDWARMELRCGACGYGVVVGAAPASCPMCRSSTWEPHPRAAGGNVRRFPQRLGGRADDVGRPPEAA